MPEATTTPAATAPANAVAKHIDAALDKRNAAHRAPNRTANAVRVASPPVPGEPGTALHSEIAAWAGQPRKQFDAEAQASLKASIIAKGLLEPLLLRPHPKPTGSIKYELIAGEYRWRAIGEAIGDRAWPADRPIQMVLHRVDDAQALDMALAENIERASMHPLDEGRAFQRMVKAGDATEAIALRYGKTQRWVQKRIKLATDLAPEVAAKFQGGGLTLAQAQVLTGAPKAEQVKVAKQVDTGMDAGDVAREMARRAMEIDTAIFAAADYKGPMLFDEDGKPTHYADGKQAAQLQRAAVAKRIEALKAEGWKAVEKVDWFQDYGWQHCADKTRATFIIALNPGSLIVTEHGGRIKVAEAAKAGRKAAAKAAPREALTIRHREYAHQVKTRALQLALANSVQFAMAGFVLAMFETGDTVRISRDPGQQNEHAALDAQIVAALKTPLSRGWLYRPHQAARDLAKHPGDWEQLRIKPQHDAAFAGWAMDTANRGAVAQLFTRIMARATGTFAGYQADYGDLPAALTLARAARAEVQGWEMTADYLGMMDGAGLRRVAQACIPGLDAGTLTGSRADLIAAILKHPKRNKAWLPPELQFADSATVEKAVTPPAEKPAPKAKAKKPAAKVKAPKAPKAKGAKAAKVKGKPARKGGAK